MTEGWLMKTTKALRPQRYEATLEATILFQLQQVITVHNSRHASYPTALPTFPYPTYRPDHGIVSCLAILASVYSIFLSRSVSFSLRIASRERQDMSKELRKSAIRFIEDVMTSMYSRFAQSCWICRWIWLSGRLWGSETEPLAEGDFEWSIWGI